MLYPLYHAKTDFSMNDTSWMLNKVMSDTVVTCIGSRVQENVLQFGQNHKQSPYFWVYCWILNPLIGIKLPKIYCYMSMSMKFIDITTNSKKEVAAHKGLIQHVVQVCFN